MHPLIAALWDWTCLAPKSAAGSERIVTRAILFWLSWLGVGAGVLTSGFYLPMATALLPPDVVLPMSMALQGFLLSFNAEAALGATVRHNPRVDKAPGLVAIALLLKFAVYRQFFPEETARLLLLGTVVQFSAPAMLLMGRRPHSLALPSPSIFSLVPLGIAILVTCGAGTGDLPGTEMLHKIAKPVGGILAGIALARLMVAAYARERHENLTTEMLFAAALPCEIGAITGYLFARFL